MTSQENAVPVWFWVVSGLAVVWNALGVMAYIADFNQSVEDIAKLPQITQDLYAMRPDWAVWAFAVAVFAGLLGSILLLLKRKLASQVFLLSLVALLVQNYFWFGMAKAHQHFPASSQVMPALVIVIAIFLIWFARNSTARGWLR
ncbi:MAG: hypothetical protein AAF431_18045 [Pseudomonadota bacterium]